MKHNSSNPQNNGTAFDEMLRRATAAQERAGEAKATPQATGPTASQADGTPAYTADAEEAAPAQPDAPGSDSTHAPGKKANGKQRMHRAFKQLVDEDDDVDMSLRSWLGGDILGSRRFRRQIGYLLLLSVLAIIYVSNRYIYQREEIRHEDLNKQLVDRKFKALTISSELTEYSMRSSVEENLTDTTLQTSTRSSYYLPVDSTGE